MDIRKAIVETEMNHFDRLSPQWRELVREHNYLPKLGETFESYKARCRLSNLIGVLL
jgi:hypothetical protein